MEDPHIQIIDIQQLQRKTRQENAGKFKKKQEKKKSIDQFAQSFLKYATKKRDLLESMTTSKDKRKKFLKDMYEFFEKQGIKVPIDTLKQTAKLIMNSFKAMKDSEQIFDQITETNEQDIVAKVEARLRTFYREQDMTIHPVKHLLFEHSFKPFRVRIAPDIFSLEASLENQKFHYCINLKTKELRLNAQPMRQIDYLHFLEFIMFFQQFLDKGEMKVMDQGIE